MILPVPTPGWESEWSPTLVKPLCYFMSKPTLSYDKKLRCTTAAHADTYGHSYTHPDANTYSDPDAYGYTATDVHSHSYNYTDADQHANGLPPRVSTA